MVVTTTESGDLAVASFANSDMTTTDTECASLKWTGAFAYTESVFLEIRNKGMINNAIYIPGKNMQIAY